MPYPQAPEGAAEGLHMHVTVAAEPPTSHRRVWNQPSMLGWLGDRGLDSGGIVISSLVIFPMEPKSKSNLREAARGVFVEKLS